MSERDEYSAWYDAVYSQDNPTGKSYGWIQWKGTDVCMDLHCECGAHGHIDADFFYHYRCAACGAVYAVGSNVKLIRMTDEQIAIAAKYSCEPREDERLKEVEP